MPPFLLCRNHGYTQLMKMFKLVKALVITLVFAIVGWEAMVYPGLILNYAALTIVTGLFLILICFTPIAAMRFGHNPSMSRLRWLQKLLTTQLALVVVTFAGFLVYILQGPEAFKHQLSAQPALSMISQKTLWWGCYPWLIFAFWALVIAYLSYIKNRGPYFEAIACEGTPKKLQPAIKSYAEASIAGANTLVIVFVTGTVILLLVRAIELIFGLNLYQLPMITVSIIFMFSPIYLIKPLRKFIQIRLRRMPFNSIVIGMILGMTGMLGIAAWLTRFFAARHPELARITCQECQRYFDSFSPDVRLVAIYWGWWMLCTPLAGSYIAKISQGRTLREVILGTLVFPLLLVLAYFTVDHQWLQNSLQASLQILEPWYNHPQYGIVINCALAAVVLFCLLRFVGNQKDNRIFHSGVMPVPDHIPKGRMYLWQAPKLNGIGRDALKLYNLTLGTIFVHLVLGWFGVQVQLLSMGLMVLSAIYVGFGYLVYHLVKDKAWKQSA